MFLDDFVYDKIVEKHALSLFCDIYTSVIRVRVNVALRCGQMFMETLFLWKICFSCFYC